MRRGLSRKHSGPWPTLYGIVYSLWSSITRRICICRRTGGHDIHLHTCMHLPDASQNIRGLTRQGQNVKAFYGCAESVSEKMKRITENCRTATLRTVSVSNGCESISKASILKELGHGHGHGLHAHQIKICICIFIQQKCQARRAVLCPRFCSPSSSICVQLTRPGHKKKAVRATAQKRYNSRRELRFKFSV